MSVAASRPCMPAFFDGAEPVSVLAARAARAGLLRRFAALAPAAPANAAPHGMTRPHERGVPPTGLQPPELAAFFQRWWPVVRAHTDTDRFRAEALLSVLWQVREVDGDLVECGSYRCGLGFLFGLAVKEWGLATSKSVHLYDSFEGLPPLTGEDRAGSADTMFYHGQFEMGDALDTVRAFLAEHGLDGIVHLHRGWFDQTLPLIAPEQRFCFTHIDCDLYQSAQTCFTHLTPRFSPGAGVVIDDYDSFGMYRATWQQLEQTGSQAPVRIGALKQAHYFTGGAGSTESTESTESTRSTPALAGAGDRLEGLEDWSPLLANRPYCAYLAALCGEMILVCSGPANEPRDATLIADLDRILGAERKLAFLEGLIAFLYHKEERMAHDGVTVTT